MSAVEVYIDYTVAARGRLIVTHAELRERGVQMEDWESVQDGVDALVAEQVKSGEFNAMSDWTEWDRRDVEILNGAECSPYIDWDDLTAEEQARVPESDRP